MRTMDNDKSGAGIGLPALIALAGCLLERSTRGGLIVVGSLNLWQRAASSTNCPTRCGRRSTSSSTANPLTHSSKLSPNSREAKHSHSPVRLLVKAPNDRKQQDPATACGFSTHPRRLDSKRASKSANRTSTRWRKSWLARPLDPGASKLVARRFDPFDESAVNPSKLL
jgi:hypothetical protein